MAKATEAERLRRAMTTNAARLAVAVERVDKLEAQRTELYRRARAANGDGNRRVITFKDIAQLYGITEPAVIQRCKRAGII